MLFRNNVNFSPADSARGTGTTEIVSGTRQDSMSVLSTGESIIDKIQLISQHNNDVGDISPVILLDENGKEIPSLLPDIKFGESEYAVRKEIAESDLEDATIAKYRLVIKNINKQEQKALDELEALGLKFEKAWTTTDQGDYSKESVLAPNDLMEQKKGSDVLWAKTGMYFGGIRFVKKIGEYSVFISTSSISRMMGTSRGTSLIAINGNSEIFIKQLNKYGGGMLDLTRSESDIYDVSGNIVARESSKTFNLRRDGDSYTQEDTLELVIDNEGKLIGDFKPYEAVLFFSREPQGD